MFRNSRKTGGSRGRKGLAWLRDFPCTLSQATGCKFPAWEIIFNWREGGGWGIGWNYCPVNITWFILIILNNIAW